MRRFLFLGLLAGCSIGSSVLKANPAVYALTPIATMSSAPSTLNPYITAGIQISYQPWTGNPKSFYDPNLPAGYGISDVQQIGSSTYVGYTGPGATVGNGIVDVYNSSDVLTQRLITGGSLDAPLGMVIAPTGFSDIGGDLLVANGANGTVGVYNHSTGAFIELLHDVAGNPLSIDGLWGVQFGQTTALQNTLFFTANPPNNTEPILGEIVPATPLPAVPEPATWLLMAGGLAAVAIHKRRAAGRRA